MQKKKTKEQFVNTFIYKLLKLPKGRTTPSAIIRFPDGKHQLLEIVQTLHSFLSIFDRIHHHGWFEDQTLSRLSDFGEELVEIKDVLVISLIDGKIVFNYMDWDHLRSTHPNINADLNARYYDLKPVVAPYTIHIKSTNHLKLTEYGKQLITETFSDTPKPSDTYKLLAGYKCFFNKANGCWQHNQSFGSKKDHQYGTDAGVIIIIRNGYIELSTYSNGGMTGLEFTEKDRTRHPKNADDMTINYTLKLAKTLVDEEIVSAPKRWEKK